jgi:hypothetical protein
MWEIKLVRNKDGYAASALDKVSDLLNLFGGGCGQ